MSDFKVGDRVMVADNTSNYYLKKGVIDRIFTAAIRYPYLVLFEDGSSAGFNKNSLLRESNYQTQEVKGPVANVPDSALVKTENGIKTLGEILKEKLATNGTMVVNNNGGMKADGGKIDFTLLLKDLPKSVESVVKVLDLGSKRYGRTNYSKVETERYEASVMRHIMSHLSGDLVDPDSGEPHLSHAICGLLFIVEGIKNGTRCSQ